MATRRRKNIVVEDRSREVLNEIRDTERQVMNKLRLEALEELQTRGRRHQGPTGNYNAEFFAEVEDSHIGLRMGNAASHAHLVELGTGVRSTATGANRGVMPAFGVIRKSALAFRRTVFDAVEKALKRD